MPAIGRLSSGGINITYRCTAACAHCLPASSPQRERAVLSRETARALLAACRRRGVEALHIGGGEPFLEFEALVALIEEMNAAHVAIDYVETNAYWATGTDRDVERLQRLRGLGVDAVMFSLCPYHAEYVPLARVKNAVRAARAVGMPYFVYQTQFAREVEALGDEHRTHPLAAYEALRPGGVDRLVERFGVRVCGRAALTYAHLDARPTEALLRASRPCDACTRTQHFHVDAYGCFVPSGCNGIGVPLADWDDVGGDRQPALALLGRGGVAALVEAARGIGFAPHAAYPNGCALCQHARAHLAMHAPDAWPDLVPLDFYAALYRG